MNTTAQNHISVTEIDCSSHPAFMNHETVYKIRNNDADITAFVGVHNSALGPALGGIRFKYYESEHEALKDVLRLSEAMTWKNAAGALNHGGGTSVVMAKQGQRTPDKAVLDTMAAGLNAINQNGAVYFGAEDMNFNEAALDTIAETAPWIKGVTSNDPNIVSGSPSPLTAKGVFGCMKRAVKFKLDNDSVRGVRISMQGLGAVGAALAIQLHAEGAILTGCDINDDAFENLAKIGVNVKRVGLDEIYDEPSDVFAPNAIGGTLTDESINRLKVAGVQIVCGAANHPQDDQLGGTQSKLMHKLGILYCPDYIVNAGGVIWVGRVGENAKTVTQEIVEGVPKRFGDVLEMHKNNPDKDMATLAKDYAKKRIENAEDNARKSASEG